MSTKSNLFKKIAIFVLVPAVVLLGTLVFKGNNYLLSSLMFAIVSIIPFFYKYEQSKPQAREFIIVAVMIAIAVSSRVLFSFIPGLSPIISIVIICGAAFGREEGFLCGSLSALLSNMFFGQGPWTLYQMLLWGIIGYIAGLLNKMKILDQPIFRCLYGIVAGVLFSVLIDFLTVLGSGFTLEKYIALLIPAIPFMGYYAFSNVLFLYFLYVPMMKKLNRVKLKYGLTGVNNNFVNTQKNLLAKD